MAGEMEGQRQLCFLQMERVSHQGIKLTQWPLMPQLTLCTEVRTYMEFSLMSRQRNGSAFLVCYF